MLSLLALSSPLVLTGCANDGLSEQEAEQLVSDAVAAMAAVTTCKFDVNSAITVEMAGGTEAGRVETTADGTGAVDRTDKQMQVTLNTTAIVHGAGERELGVEHYVVDDWLYVRLALPEMGDRWLKTRLTDEVWEVESQLDQQIELMETATEVGFVGSENVNGTACYVVEMVPSIEKLTEFLSQQTVPGTGMDWAEINLEPLVEETSIVLWIAKDSYLLMKTEINILMELAAEDVGVGSELFEKVTMDMSATTKLYDHNQPVSIELPEEALEASEIPAR